MARKIRMGFIGVGSMGFSHLQLFHKDCGKQAEAVAVCARDAGRIQRAMAVAPEMTLFKREIDLIESDLDAVVISSPNFTHVPLALAALKAGKHIFLEKPVGITPVECRKLLPPQELNARILLTGHGHPSSPSVVNFKPPADAVWTATPRTTLCKELRIRFQSWGRD